MNKNAFNQLYEVLKDDELAIGMIRQALYSAYGSVVNPKDSFDHGNNAGTIILTPGFLCSNGAMLPIGEELKEKYNVVYAPRDTFQNMGNISQIAKNLGKKALKVLKEQELNGDLNLLGHSLGGLVSIEALRITVGLEVNKLITCAAPFQGTPIADFIPFIPSAKQMNTPGGYLGDKYTIGDKSNELISYVASADTYVPPSSQIPNKGLHPKTQIIEMEGFTHTDFVVGDKAKKFTKMIKDGNK